MGIKFSYTGTKDGKAVEGTVEAESKELALGKIQELKERGLQDIHIENAQTSDESGQQKITSEERTLKDLRPSWRVYLIKNGGVIILAPIGLVLAVIAKSPFWMGLLIWAIGIALAAAWIDRLGKHYTITNKRITTELGIFSKDRSEIDITHVRNLQMKQSILQRLIGVGNVFISTAGMSDFEVVLKDVEDPTSLIALIKKQ